MDVPISLQQTHSEATLRAPNPPGRGPVRHTRRYDKVVYVQGQQGRWTINGEAHTFINDGNVPLKQMDVRLSPRFIQENLE